MKKLVVIRGGGELATGIAHRLYHTGHRVLMLERQYPSAIRRNIVFSEAIYDGETSVERTVCYRADDLKHAEKMLKEGKLVIMIDPEAKCISKLKPEVVVDAIYAKRNLGTNMKMAPLTIGVGPGFVAGKDVNCVIETARGHNLGRIIREGIAMPERELAELRALMKASHSINSPCDGYLEAGHPTAYLISKNEVIGKLHVEGGHVLELKSPIDGVLRGMLHDDCPVRTGLKIAEIDPSTKPANCMSISAKTRCVSGSVLEVIVAWKNKQPQKSHLPWKK
ncbi:MAG: EF2563 family selenium-dependent molybdenum hydroxylase system protein [Anaerovibrio sp.]|uniref:selenium-dependent molybdenum cofactor biosynthesis protein YqeB n=1 Tax=Anaerovibrio sp. TaxID=1872532 RepID=UPI0025EC0386|nr:selenium-dependent molybdenum cofactor biosynthesis protein YqeB [Anaerovibrio sp.]MCR5176144.1 EF2563 family selenium-dependent molybdenum hydroxylase system protein [Anaerovibrio sp.]